MVPASVQFDAAFITDLSNAARKMLRRYELENVAAVWERYPDSSTPHAEADSIPMALDFGSFYAPAAGRLGSRGLFMACCGLLWSCFGLGGPVQCGRRG